MSFFSNRIFSDTGGGHGDLAGSYLVNGVNDTVSPEQVRSAFGAEKISELASQPDLNKQEVAGRLSEALPQVADKGSSGGNLLNSLGCVEGVLGMAGKLFR